MSDIAVAPRPWFGGGAGDAMRSPALPCRAFASVEVHADPRAALPAWRALAESAPASPYQSPDWMLPWIEAIGRPSGLRPLIAVARDAEGRATALLPLGLGRRGGLNVACFLGGKDANYNLGLFAPGPAPTREALLGLLRRVAAESGARVDLFALRNQPLSWGDMANPLWALGGQPSPSFAYKAEVGRDAEAFFAARLSRDTRRKLRQKMRWLGALGPVSVTEARTAVEAAAVLDAFAAQRAARNAASGLPSDDLPALRQFLDRTVGEGGPVVFYALRCGDRIVATLGGARLGGRFSGMLTSFEAAPEVARTSPGELLIAEAIRLSCAAGLVAFDLGIGEGRYKETFCPEVEPLFDTLVPVTARGIVVARAEATRLQAKRAIKQSPWAWPVVQRLRRLRQGLRGGSPSP